MNEQTINNPISTDSRVYFLSKDDAIELIAGMLYRAIEQAGAVDDYVARIAWVATEHIAGQPLPTQSVEYAYNQVMLATTKGLPSQIAARRKLAQCLGALMLGDTVPVETIQRASFWAKMVAHRDGRGVDDEIAAQNRDFEDICKRAGVPKGQG